MVKLQGEFVRLYYNMETEKRKSKKIEKLKLQADFCADCSNVLDVGFSANQNPYIKNAFGLDIHLPNKILPNYLDAKKCNLNHENIPYNDALFDAVIAGDVIEHVENPSHFLREVNRVLANNGKLIISTPQASDWWTTLHNWFFRSLINDPDPGEHLQNWTMLDMKRLLKKNGFDLDKIEGYYMHFPKIPLKIRVKHLPALSWQVFYVAKKNRLPEKSILVKIDGNQLQVTQ
jgi:SAM-dependent methyltransferase